MAVPECVSGLANCRGRGRVSVGQRSLAHYSARLVCALAIMQLVCGIALVVLSALMFRFDPHKALSWSIGVHWLEGLLPDLLRIVWLGLWVVTSGLVTLIASFRPYSTCQSYSLLLCSLLTIAITGVFSILISNHVIQHSALATVLTRDSFSAETRPIEVRLKQSALLTEEYLNRPNPTLLFHVFMLCFCTVTFVISIISFCIVSHHLCWCTALPSKCAVDCHIYDTSTWTKKERIVQWVMQQQQSQLSASDQSECVSGHRTTDHFVTADEADLRLNCAKLNAHHSTATTDSTKLSIYKS